MKKFAGIFLLAFVMILAAACSSSTGGSASGDSTGDSSGGNSDSKASSDTGSTGLWQPKKDIEIVVPSAAGGGWDTTARLTGKFLQKEGLVKKNIGIVNKVGGGGAVGWAYVHQKNSPSTIFVTSPPILLVPMTGHSQYTYKDFTPIANMIAGYGAFAVKADSKYKSINDVFKAMKKDPSSVTLVGASSPGSMDQIQFLKAAKAAGVDIKKVKYVSDPKGAMADILNGSADVYTTDVATMVPQVKAGKVRVLAVTSPERLEGQIASKFPTLKEQGVDATFTNWRGFFGPPDMDPAAVKFYEQKLKALSNSDKWAEVRKNNGWSEKFMGHDEYVKFIAQQQKDYHSLLSELGLLK
ncbi:MAG TPA: tripartite tricarboxylate transporter substrate-binding protein [Bacillales bacterium]|nr:tripartite tricarboxylate transporter substrate-binding protein [Bacillales bacterium]